MDTKIKANVTGKHTSNVSRGPAA